MGTNFFIVFEFRNYTFDTGSPLVTSAQQFAALFGHRLIIFFFVKNKWFGKSTGLSSLLIHGSYAFD